MIHAPNFKPSFIVYNQHILKNGKVICCLQSTYPIDLLKKKPKVLSTNVLIFFCFFFFLIFNWSAYIIPKTKSINVYWWHSNTSQAFLDGERATRYLASEIRNKILLCAATEITDRYYELASDLVSVVSVQIQIALMEFLGPLDSLLEIVLINFYHEQARKTESSLQKIRQSAQRRAGASSDISDNNVSDTDKICMQLFLDIQVGMILIITIFSVIFLILACTSTTRNSLLLNLSHCPANSDCFHLHNLSVSSFIYVTFLLQIVTRSMPVTSLHWGLKQSILHPTVHYGNVWLLQIGKTQLISKSLLLWS